MFIRRLTSAAVAVPLLGWTYLAVANMAAPQHHPSILSPPTVQERTPLVVDRERLVISCFDAAGSDEPDCRFEATYWVRNPTNLEQQVTPGFVSEMTEQVEIWLGGRRVDRPLSELEADRLVPTLEGESQPADPRFAQPPGEQSVHSEPSLEERMMHDMLASAVRGGTVRGFDLQLSPGAASEVTIRGRLTPGEYWEPSPYLVIDARKARHPLLAPDSRSGQYEVQYLIAPIETWGASGPIEVVVQHPSSWDADVESQGGVSHTTAPDGRSELRFVTTAKATPILQVVFELPRARFHPGGPVAGIGGTFGDAGGFRMRLGWEISEPDWLLYSATADTNFDDVLVLTPMVEAATPWILIIPSVAFGLGMPVRVEPETEVGIRFQGTVAFGPAAWVTSYDLFPGVDSWRADSKQVTMLFQLTL